MKVKFLYFFKKSVYLGLFVIFLISAPLTYSNDIKINVSPAQVSLGETVRFSIETSQKYRKIELVFSKSKSILLNSIRDNYWNKEILLSGDSFKVGLNTVTLVFYSQTKIEHKIPYEININPPIALSDYEFDGSISQIAKDDVADMKLKVSDLRNNIDLLQFEKKTLEQRYMNLEKQLKKMKKNNISESNLIQKENELNELSRELEIKSNSLANFVNLLEKRSEMLNIALQKVENRKIVYERESDRLKKEQEQLKKSKTNVAQAQEFVMKKRGILREKETALIHMEKVVAEDRKALLASKDELEKNLQIFNKNQQKLSVKENNISKRESDLAKQQAILDEFKNEIAQKTLNLRLEKESLTAKFSQLEESDSRMKSILDTQMKTLLSKEKNLRDKSISMDKSYNDLIKQKDIFLREKDDLKRDKTTLIKLQSELQQREQDIKNKQKEYDYKLKLYQDLKAMFQNDIDRLKYDYLKGNEYQTELLYDLEKQMAKMSQVTSQAQKKSEYIHEKYLDLNAKNSQLQSRIDDYLRTDYRYGVMPYVGSSYSSEVQDAIFGISAYFFYDYRYCFSLSFSSVSFIGDKSTELFATVDRKIINDFVFNYFLNPFDRLSLFLGIGMSQSVLSTSYSVAPAIGVKYDLVSKPYFYKFEISKPDEFLFKFGFAKYFKRVFKHNKVNSNYFSPANDQSLDLDLVSSNLPIVSLRKTPINLLLDDKHWAYYDYLVLLRYNLLPSNFYLADVNAALSVDHAKDLIYFAHNSQNYQDRCVVRFNVKGDISSYKATVSVIDNKENVIRYLLKDNFIHLGKHELYWDQHNEQGELVDSGTYVIKILLTPVIEGLGKPIENSFVVNLEAPYLLDSNPDSLKSYKMYVSEKVNQLNVFDVPLSGMNSISRIDFIIALTNIMLEYDPSISYMPGVVRPNYLDYDELSIKQQKKINIFAYCLEPNSSNKALRPYDAITQAEAVVLINRFLRWQKSTLSNSID